MARATYQADALPARPPVGEPGRTVEALTIEIQHAAQARPGVAMGPAVGTIEAFAREALPPVTVGQRIEATVSLVGDTQARRWFISDIRVLAE